MFDNPDKALSRLQRKLLEEEEIIDEETDEDPEEALYEMKEFLEQDEWDGENREPLYRSYSNREEPEAEYPEEIPVEPKKKNRNIGGLLLAVFLEILAVLGVLAWWFLWS